MASKYPGRVMARDRIELIYDAYVEKRTYGYQGPTILHSTGTYTETGEWTKTSETVRQRQKRANSKLVGGGLASCKKLTTRS